MPAALSRFGTLTEFDTLAGVPNGAARQNTRSTGQNSAGWEIEHWPHALAGKYI